MPNKIIFGLLALLFSLNASYAHAASIQWDLSNMNETACLGFICSPPPYSGQLTGNFVVTNGNLTSWNIAQFSSPTPQPALGDLGPNGLFFFSTMLAGSFLNITFDPSLLSGTSPIPAQAVLDYIGLGAPEVDFSGYLVNDATTPLPQALPLFAAAIGCLIFIGMRQRTKLLQRN
jgi:hypothetical protein